MDDVYAVLGELLNDDLLEQATTEGKKIAELSKCKLGFVPLRCSV